MSKKKLFNMAGIAADVNTKESGQLSPFATLNKSAFRAAKEKDIH